MTEKKKSTAVSKDKSSANKPKSVAKSEPYVPKHKAMGIRFKGNAEDGLVINADTEECFAKLFNCDDSEQAAILLGQCTSALAVNEMNDKNPMHDLRYLMASLIRDLKPEDAVERMLVTQMAVTHAAAMRTAQRLARTDSLERLEVHEAGYNRLMRTFTAQMEALRKHRHGGKQTVTVQHVNVEDGGQAIVGNVDRGGVK